MQGSMTGEERRYEGSAALVVDDDAAVRLLIRRLLERRGFEVEEAADGVGALRATTRRRFSVVITDLEMPGLDGIAFMHEARARGLDAPVVFLTAVGSVPTAVEAIKGGAFEFLEKPLRADRLVQVIDSAMSAPPSGSLSISVDLANRSAQLGAAAPAEGGVTGGGGEGGFAGATPGARIGRYEVLARIGRGGMGEVFRCRDPLIGRLVAVKVLQPGAERPERADEMLARFHREAAAAGALAHPGIVAVFDLGREEHLGLWYIVLELVEGQGLNRVLAERGRLPAAEAALLGFQMADALAFAHARGVVHRDVKPSNVFVRDDGTVKLLDFGLAALQGWDVTQGGHVFGSPSYMAPERIRGRPGGPAADQFSLGVVLYEALTGQNPFAAPTPEARLHRVLHDEPPPLGQVVPGVPAAFAEVVTRLMAKDEGARFTGLDVGVEELGRIAASLGRIVQRQPGATIPPPLTRAGETP
jgi:CheY-like chemotaxis protein